MGITEGWSGGPELVASMHISESGPEMALRIAREGSERLERAECAAELERQAELEDKHEAMLVRYAQMGLGPHSLASVFDQASRAADEDAELADAQKTIVRIERRREVRRQAALREADQLAAVQRADSTDLLGPAKALHAEFVRVSRAAQAAAMVRPSGARTPFSAGVVRRSEQCHWCVEQGASDEESYLLHSDPEYNVPVTPPKSAEQAVTAERRTPGRRYAEISR